MSEFKRSSLTPVVMPDHAVAISGHMRSGKTTTALAVLIHAMDFRRSGECVLWISHNPVYDLLDLPPHPYLVRASNTTAKIKEHAPWGHNASFLGKVIIDLSFFQEDGKLYSFYEILPETLELIATLGKEVFISYTVDTDPAITLIDG